MAPEQVQPKSKPPVDLDGSIGEGGGQILRTALSLSLVTGQPFHLRQIRARRPKPGLQRQHLAAVEAAAAIGRAEVAGASLGATELDFRPGAVVPGDYAFAVGTAGSTTLVLQTVLPALMTASAPSTLLLEGGTHNPLAPPFEFLARTFLPLLERLGPRVRIKLDRHGFYPAGGGKIRVEIVPAPVLCPVDLLERGEVTRLTATAVVANLPRLIAERELAVLKRALGLKPGDLHLAEVKSPGPGNVVFVELQSAALTEICTGFGERGLRAEVVAERLATQVQRHLETAAPVGEHLADQWLLPLALAGGGRFRTRPLSSHALTNLEVIRRFLPVEVSVSAESDRVVRVELRGADSGPELTEP